MLSMRESLGLGGWCIPRSFCLFTHCRLNWKQSCFSHYVWALGHARELRFGKSAFAVGFHARAPEPGQPNLRSDSLRSGDRLGRWVRHCDDGGEFELSSSPRICTIVVILSGAVCREGSMQSSAAGKVHRFFASLRMTRHFCARESWR